MHNLKEVKIWNKAIELSVEVYKATSNFPTNERFGLTSQSRRAAVSIPSILLKAQEEIQRKSLAIFLELQMVLRMNWKRS